ncbi:G-protein coupled receptor 12-like [Heptranchias perlo]|uniref:G-protein coupled receptor 12-like n=1 Tax=Heptranchias perlo TaxID=212740 RepID=UPI003559694C
MADMLNDYFASVFTVEKEDRMPEIPRKQILNRGQGLNKINISKATASADDMCNISQVAVHCCIREVTEALYKLLNKFITFPLDREKPNKRARGFARIAGFPMCRVPLAAYIMLSMPPVMNDQTRNSSKLSPSWLSPDSNSSITTSDLPPETVNPWDIALCVTGTVISCENAIVVAVIFYTPTLRAPMFILIGSLALADLLGGLGLILNFIFLYLLNFEAAKLVSAALLIASFSASVCNLLVITIDRYLSLYNALTYHTERTTTFTYLMLSVIWVTCISLGALPIAGWNCIEDETSCSVIKPITKNNAAVLSVSFLLIFALMLQLYVQICKIAFRHAQQIAVQYHFVATANTSTRKGISTLSVILGTFAACWIPFAIYCLIADSSYPLIYTYVTVLPATCNSVINPIIYAYRNPDIQKSLWVACCGCIPSNFSFRPRSSSDV